MYSIGDVVKVEPKAAEKKATTVSLTDIQKRTIAVGSESVIDDTLAIKLSESWSSLRKMDLTPADIKKLSAQLSKKTKININMQLASAESADYKNLFDDGVIKNQFMLGKKATSEGFLGPKKGSARDIWEEQMSKGILQENSAYKAGRENGFLAADVAAERPVYGYLFDQKNKNGSNLEGRYGRVTFELKSNTKDRATMFRDNSSVYNPTKSTDKVMNKDNNENLVSTILARRDKAGVSNADLRKIIDGEIDPVAFTAVTSDYVEAQVYGGIDLTKDIQAIHVPDSGVGFEHVKELAEKYKIPYITRDGSL